MSRAQRNDADVDMKVLVEQITVDFLLVHSLPEWPAALPMLLRLVSTLLSKAGMHSPDNSVRLVSVDLLGLIAAQLCYEAHVAGSEAEAVADILKEHGVETDAGRQLLLAYLADRRHGDSALSAGATEFMLCQTFAGEAAQLQKSEASEEEQAALLSSYRTQLAALSRPAASPLSEGELSFVTLLSCS